VTVLRIRSASQLGEMREGGSMERPSREAAGHAGRAGPPLWVVALVHVLLLPVYAAWCLMGAASEFLWAGGLIMGAVWLVAGFLFIRWSREGRSGIVLREVVWALLSWLNIGPVLLVWIPRTRPLLVPRAASGHAATPG